MKFLTEYPGDLNEMVFDKPRSYCIGYKLNRCDDGIFRYAFEVTTSTCGMGGSFIPLKGASIYEDAEVALREVLHQKLSQFQNNLARDGARQFQPFDETAGIETSISSEISDLVANPVANQIMGFEWHRHNDDGRVQIELLLVFFAPSGESEIHKKTVRWEFFAPEKALMKVDNHPDDVEAVDSRECRHVDDLNNSDLYPNSGFSALI